ncbi:60S ribosomal L11 [Olea europaea subsp. europaea]|uniref:60S ribosomal L11 n=1 Tax=Olea europaea subsp. europaea TaxID=158383 RepID=A0A8S0R0C1_OLEEU|nr:60S ribosomal L11 [Olea europaea subsp. europaea]
MQLLESGLKVKEYELLRRNFCETGCFGFGCVPASLPGCIGLVVIAMDGWYDPSTGIYDMDFYVVLECPGYRVGAS